MSDYDYINEHMGGFDSDGLPNFLSHIGESGMDGYGDVDYAYFHADAEAIDVLIFSIRMVNEAVKLLPYKINDKKGFGIDYDNIGIDNIKFQFHELVGLSDAWKDILGTFEKAADLRILGSNNIPTDYFIFIHPKKYQLKIKYVGKHDKESDEVEFYISPDPEIDEEKWNSGAYSALKSFLSILSDGYFFRSIERLTAEEYNNRFSHALKIKDIYLELERVNHTGDNKTIKELLMNLVTEKLRFYNNNIHKYNIAIEVSDKGNPMPTFRIKPENCEGYYIFEINKKGKIITRYFLTEEELKEKYSLIDGEYLVPSLDFVRAEKIDSIELGHSQNHTSLL